MVTNYSIYGGFRLSPEAIVNAKAAKEKPVNIKIQNSDSKLKREFFRLRRFRNETQNLLADLLATQKHPRPLSTTPWFVVPHTNLFDGYVDDRSPDDDQAELPKFLFGIRDLEGEALDFEARKIHFQIGDVFRFWRDKNEAHPAHRNIMPDVVMEEIAALRTHLQDAPVSTLSGIWVEEIGAHNIVDPGQFEKANELQRRLNSIVSGVLSWNMSEYVELKKDIDEVYHKPMDRKIAAKYHDLLSASLRSRKQIEKLQAIFSVGEFFGLNSCPDLPNDVRIFYERQNSDNAVKRDVETLVGQIIDVIQHFEEKNVSGRDKSPVQIDRDARLLATIHVSNKILDHLFVDGKTVLRQQICLVTNADRIADVVNGIGEVNLRVPVRHPRLLASSLRHSHVEPLIGPMTIVAATLDDHISTIEKELGSNKSQSLSRNHIDTVRKSVSDTWRSFVTNLVVASSSIDQSVVSVGGAGLSRALRQNQQKVAESSLGTSGSRTITDDDRRIGLSVLSGQAAYTTRDHLLAKDNSKKSIDRALYVGITATAAKYNEVAVIPAARELRFAIKLSSPEILGRLSRVHPGPGPYALSLHDLKCAIDKFHDRKFKPPDNPPLADYMANRMALALQAMAESNWNFARAICSYAIDKFDQSSEDVKAKNKALQLELLFARQLAARGLAAKASLNAIAQEEYLDLARSDIEKMAEIGGQDWRVRLNLIAFTNERLVYDENARRGGHAEKLRRPGLDEKGFHDHVVDMQTLFSEIKRDRPKYGTKMLYPLFVYFRALEFLLITYLILKDDESVIYIGAEYRAKFEKFIIEEVLGEFRDIFEKIKEEMNRIFRDIKEHSVEGAYLFAEYLTALGEVLLLRAELDRGSLDLRRLLTYAADVFEGLEKMRTCARKLSFDGFARNIARSTTLRLVAANQDFILKKIGAHFDHTFPKAVT
jgi:hypothetical protein